MAAPASDSSSAAFASFRLRNWTVDDGLLGRANDVAQTADGYLWVTTDLGLFRFDGARFVGFSTATVPAFRSDNLNAVDVLPSGDLWVGTRDFWTYRLRDGEWTAYPIEDAFRDIDWVQNFVQDGNGVVWASGTGRSISRFDGTRWVPIEQRIRNVWTPFVADAEGTIWTYLDAADVPGVPISPIHSKRSRQAVVARWDGQRFSPPNDWRLFGFEPTAGGPLFHRPVGGGVAPTSLVGANDLRVQLADADGIPRGSYVMGSVPRSAILVDRAGRVWTEPLNADGSVTVLVGDTEVARILPEGSKWIERLFEDRQGNVWVLSSSGGLLQVTPDPFRRLGPDEGAPLMAESAAVAADGTVLVSAAGGSESTPLFAVRGSAWTSRFIEPGPAVTLGDTPSSNPTVGRITQDGRGRQFGTFQNQLIQFDGNGVVRRWQSPNALYLSTLFSDPADPDALWVGNSGGALWRFDTDVFAPADSIQVPAPQAGDAWTTDVLRAPDGTLWVASRGGLAVLDNEGRLKPVDALAGVPIRDLATGPDGVLWAATETRGLVRIRDGALETFGLSEGLPTSHIVAVLFDNLGFVWMPGRVFVYRARISDIETALDAPGPRPVDVVTLPPSAGHLGSANILLQAAKAPDGALWIPSDQGVTRIDPRAYARQFATPPPVLVEAVRSQVGELAVATGEPVRLSRGDRSPVVEYTVADLTAPDLVRFRTQLVGLDDGWHDQKGARSVGYTRLSPGTYTFRVQARNGGGVWTEPAEATLVIPAYFYETWWFAALCGLGLLGALVLGVRARERTLTARQRRLEAVVEERTGQLRAEKETVAAQARSLETLDRSKSTFFANVSHEFRTPLTLTLGPLDDVLSGEYGGVTDDVAAPLRLARRSADHVLGLINQILDLTRLESGSTPVVAQRVDLAALAKAHVKAFRPLAARRGIALDLSGLDEPVEVWTDPKHAETILSNLVSNAVKFSTEKGEVNVTVEVAEGHAVLTVSDNGRGIAPDDLSHVFDRFYRASSGQHDTVGTGIGLSLAHELASLLGGTLTATSEAGVGSAFILTLPLGQDHFSSDQRDNGVWIPKTPSVPAVHDEPVVAANEAFEEDVTTVLVVDDHSDIRAFVRRHLERSGYRVIEAEDGEEALKVVGTFLPDLIVSDVMMPRLDGLGLCRALRSNPETDFIPILLLTAKASTESRLEGLAQHCDDYLTKPFDPRELVASVNNLIALRRLLRERYQTPGGASGDGSAGIEPTPDRANSGDSADEAFVRAIRTTIDRCLGDETFGVGELADAVALSRSQLGRRMAALMDTSPSDLIRTSRLDRAATLLSERAGSVGEIAYAVGFKSVAHFSNAFVAHTGVRPSEFRARTVAK